MNDHRGNNFIQVPGDRGTLLAVAFGCAALLVVGGLGPWASFGAFSAAGTDGDGWFLIGAGLLSAALLLRFNSRAGEPERLTWLVSVAGAVGAVVVLRALVELQRTEFVSVGWGAWVGAMAGVALVGISVQLIRPSAGPPLAAILAAVVIAGAGVGLGFATADGAQEEAAASLEHEWWDDSEQAVTAAEGEFSGEDLEAAESTDEPAGPGDCDELGINAEEREEGTCTREGMTYRVVNRDSTLGLPGLNVRLRGIETAQTITSSNEFIDSEHADGTFVIVDLEVRNKSNTPEAFNSYGDKVALFLDGNTFTHDTDAYRALDGSFWNEDDPIQPHASRTGKAVFDVPSRFVRELDHSGNIAILDFGELGSFTDLEYSAPGMIGVIRTYG